MLSSRVPPPVPSRLTSETWCLGTVVNLDYEHSSLRSQPVESLKVVRLECRISETFNYGPIVLTKQKTLDNESCCQYYY